MPASAGTEQSSRAARPYRGPDRRGVARFVVRPLLPTAVLLALAIAWVVAAPHSRFSVSARAVTELGAIAATLSSMAGIACLLRWRLDGIARGWWCGWALLAIGLGQLALQPVTDPNNLGAEIAALAIGMVLFARAVSGPEVDTGIRARGTLGVVAIGITVAIVIAIVVGRSMNRADLALGILGGIWIALAIIAGVRQAQGHHDSEAGWIIPVVIALGLAQLVPLTINHTPTGTLANRWFQLVATALACVGVLGGLVRAAVHHRTRALREHIDHERELANRQRIEENFADRLHEMRSTVVALEGGVATMRPLATEAPEASLRAALIGEIRRLRTLVNESPTAAGVEVFEVESALTATVSLQRANGQSVTMRSFGNAPALGRPSEIAQVVHGLLTNAAKYAPGSPVQVSVRHELDEVSIRVEDQGAGIDPEDFDRIFERGVRLNPSTGPSGDGLGLAVARRIIRNQDGDLWVEAGLSGGAAFVLSIPVAPALRVVPRPAEALPVSTIPIQEAR